MATYEPATITETTDIPPSPTAAPPYRLAITPTTDGGYTVTVDGHDIAPALTGITLNMGEDQPPQATVGLRITTPEIQPIQADVAVPPETAAALQALGWTPPPAPPES